MKKKGLLILPLAMMLIVAVALSTATYAWFAVSADAKISTLTVQTSASDGLQIAAIYEGAAKSGTMTLDTGTYTWDGAVVGYGPELSFTTAMASAYGVTGDGISANMYTAASRSVTSYDTDATNADWWLANNATLTGNEIYYLDSSGLTLATDGGNHFTNGVYSGSPEDKESTLTTGNSGGTSFFVRKEVYPTIEVSESNEGDYDSGDTFYSDSYGLTLANDGTYFTAGVWRGATNDLGDDIAAYTVATSNKIYVRSSGTTIFVEEAWSYDANNSALDGSANPYSLVAASANKDYFILKFALKTQRGMVATAEKENVADIFLKRLTVTASGGMGAASRLALFSATDGTYASLSSLYYYIPFSKSIFDTSWANTATAETDFRVIGTAPAMGSGYAYSATSTDVLPAPKVIANETLIYDNNTWGTATFYQIDKNTQWATKTAFTTAQSTATTKLNSLGTFTSANTIKYYTLVIWFEGTDNECVGTFAGTGITVDMSFDFYQQWK